MEQTTGWPMGGYPEVPPRLLYGFLEWEDYLRDLTWHGLRIRRATRAHRQRPTAQTLARLEQVRQDLVDAENWWNDEAPHVWAWPAEDLD